MSRAALLESGEPSVLSSPGVGTFFPSVSPGEVVVPGQSIGALAVLHQRIDVVVPDGGGGRVAWRASRARSLAVGYGEPLYRIEAADLAEALRGAAGDDVTAGLPEGAVAITAAMDGQFYQRPAPDEPAFLEVGQRVSPGQKVGLIEVMKFFYPVEWDGAVDAEVLELRAADARPIAAGDVLVVVRPV